MARDKRNWRREDKADLQRSMHAQSRIMGNQRELMERTRDRRSLQLIEDSYDQASSTAGWLGGILARLFKRGPDLDEVKRRKRSNK